MEPLLTAAVLETLLSGRREGASAVECSMDLGRSVAPVAVGPEHWGWEGRSFPYPARLKDRTIYYWDGAEFVPAARFTDALVKLVPTDWGAPTFEIDGIKMLPTERVSPWDDAVGKVALIEPHGKRILDCCGGLGYMAAACLAGGASEVLSFEKNPDVLWLRSLNPWSPRPDERLKLTAGDVVPAVVACETGSVDAILHDPPRFGIAGELYSQAFYDQLARVLKSRGRLFHYTGAPNRLTTGRNVPNEVARRLERAGFRTRIAGDGILATREATFLRVKG